MLTQQIFIEHLVCARHCSRNWETAVDKKDPNPYPERVYVYLDKTKKRNRKKVSHISINLLIFRKNFSAS